MLHIVYPDGTAEDLELSDMARRLLNCYRRGRITLSHGYVTLLKNCQISDMALIMQIYDYVRSAIDLRTYD